jgi:hypothetical protein
MHVSARNKHNSHLSCVKSGRTSIMRILISTWSLQVGGEVLAMNLTAETTPSKGHQVFVFIGLVD